MLAHQQGGDADATPPLNIRTKILLEEIYAAMLRISATDRAVQRGLSTGQLAFQYYGTSGQEAIAAGAAAALRPDDYLVTTYRAMHDIVAKRVPLNKIMAELYGRATGLSKGKGGAMHLSYAEAGLMVTSGIVGGGLPIANGLALASRLKADDRVTMACFGDGATSIGAFHEAMALAATWDLPVIFLCQNNQYSEYTAIHEYTRNPDFYTRAAAYGMKGVRIDGNDPLAVHDAVSEAAERARAGGGPTMIEALCHRLGGHSFGSDEGHMDQAALAEARANAPLVTFRNDLIDSGLFDEAALDALSHSVDEEVRQAEAFAENQPDPVPEELYIDVLADAGDVEGSGCLRAAGAAEPDRQGNRTITFVAAINEAFAQALEGDDRVIIMGEDIHDPAGGVTKATYGLSTRFGIERVRPTPIAEQAIIGAGIGAALAGMRPIVEIMIIDFMATCMDQIVNHAAKLRYMSGGATSVPMVIRTVSSSGLPGFGAQHSQSFEAWLTHSPGLKVVMPTTPFDAKGLYFAALADEDPVIVIEPARMLWSQSHVPEEPYQVPIGKARLVREGHTASIITYGIMVAVAEAAARDLAEIGLEVEIIDLRTLTPLDTETIFASVAKTGRAVVLHSAVEFGGFGAEIAAQIAETFHGQLKAPVKRLGSAFTPVPYSSALEPLHYPTAAALVDAVRGMVA